MNKIKVGVLGGFRGKMMMKFCLSYPDRAELVAVCDKNPDVLAECKKDFDEKGAKVALYEDFDEFLKADMEAVVLANYANEHAPFAIRCLERGLHVMSEVLPYRTLSEAVRLCEAVEKSGKIYHYAENYCFFPSTMEMHKLYKEGKLGEFEYGEGEYLHDCESIWPDITYGERDHWRNRMSGFYYCTHSSGPLLHITGLRPVSVVGFEGPRNEKTRRMGAQGAPYAVEMVTLENGAIFKSIHGIAPSRSSIWYTVYGSKGKAESGREGYSEGFAEIHTFLDGQPDVASYHPEFESNDAEAFGHGGGDYYTMTNFLAAINGEENDGVDVYQAIDMGHIGTFGFFSALEQKPMQIPNFRDKAVREQYRNDNRTTQFLHEGDVEIPANTAGNIDYPDSLYAEIYQRMLDRKKEKAEKAKKEQEEKEKANEQKA